jgi:N-acetylneuraminic acid mutarotase
MTHEGNAVMTTLAPAWTPADDLLTPAAWYGQHDGPVRLEDGTIVVAGGENAAGLSLADSAVFTPSPTKGVWSTAGALQTPRRLHTLTRLNDGRILAAGGRNGSAALLSAELYNPGTGQWTETGSLDTARWGHSATLLSDGSVMVAGGSAVRSGGGTIALRSAERFDPEHNVWHPAAAMTDARTAHTAVSFANGVILVVGGVAPTGATDDPALAFCELYDPDHKVWTPTGSLSRGRRHHRATLLSGGAVLVTGGTAPGSPGAAPFDPFSQRGVELFTPDTGVWTRKNDMPSGRALHRAIALPGDGLLVVGGAASDRDEAGYRSALTYDAVGDKWTSAAGLANGRWSFAATALADGRVLVAGGVARSGLAAADPAVTELTGTAELFGAPS